MKRIHITESIRKIARPSSRAYVDQVAFGLLLAFYNREKPVQSFDVPLLHERCRGEAVYISILAFSRHNF